jgi:O-antigen ligase
MNYKISWDGTIYDFIGVILLYMMMLMSINDEKGIKIFMWGYIIIFAFLAYEPLYYYFTGYNMAFARAEQYGTVYKGRVGFLSGHVAMGNNMNQMIPIALFAMMSIRSKLLKIPAAIPLLIFFTGLLITKSRGGVVGFIFLIALLTYFSKNRWRNGILGGFLILLLLVASGSFFSTLGRVSSGAAEGRLQGFFHGVEMLLKGRIFGVGPGCYPFARGYYFGYTLEAHNIYGEIIGELGILGAIAAFFLLWRVIKNNVEILSKLKMANKETSYLYYTTMGIQISLLVRLFVSLASHGLYIFHWYFVAAMSIIIGKLTINKIEGGEISKMVVKPFEK